MPWSFIHPLSTCLLRDWETARLSHPPVLCCKHGPFPNRSSRIVKAFCFFLVTGQNGQAAAVGGAWEFVRDGKKMVTMGTF